MIRQKSRLSSIAPKLSTLCDRSPLEKVRLVAIFACKSALSEANVENWANVIIGEIQDNQEITQNNSEQIKTAVEQFDDLYFSMDESQNPEQKRQALLYFSKARAMASLSFLLGNSLFSYVEAIYEATMAFNDQPAIIARIEAEMAR